MPVVRPSRQVGLQPLPAARETPLPIPQLPIPQITAHPTAEAYGAGFGETIARVGEQALEQEALKADNVRLTAANRQLQDWELHNIYDPETGALTKHGQNAIGLGDQVTKQYSDYTEQIRGTLTNDRQREAFDRNADAHHFEISGKVMQHEAAEVARLHQTESAATAENAKSLAIANAGDNRRVGVEINNARAAIGAYLNSQGAGPEVIRKAMDDAASSIHIGVIDRLLDGHQDQRAQAYYDRVKGEINGTDLAKIEQALGEGSTRGESMRRADQIGNGGGVGMVEPGNLDLFNRKVLQNPDGSYSTTSSITIEEDGKQVLIPTVIDGKRYSNEEAIAHYRKTGEHLGKFDSPEHAEVYATQLHNRQARAQGGQSPLPSLQEMMDQAAQIADPKLREAVEQRIKGTHAVRKQQEQDDKEATSQKAKALIDQRLLDATNIIERAHSVDAVPPSVWATFTESQRSAFRSYARQLSEKGDVETDLAAYYKLMEQASKDPEKFKDVNLLDSIHKLGKTEFKQLTELQGSIRKGDREKASTQLDGYRTNTQILNDALLQVKIDPNPKAGTDEAVAMAKLRRVLDERVMALQNNSGKKATNDDIQKIVDDLLTAEGGAKGEWFGPLFGHPFFDVPAKRRFENTAPPAPPTAPSEPTATNPKTGGRLVLRNGQWVKP